MFDEFKKAMTQQLEMTDIGRMFCYLGIEVKQMNDGIFTSQEGHIEEIHMKFNMKHCKPDLSSKIMKRSGIEWILVGIV
ncbi:hypothetical protein RJ640_022106 [Escallonia rubra]|uniref:Reverse transcriptase Ty1/copia-type domain-containing protein n=1 Tax=Escallonia rubra TaxID=112253 RepID=A0AA88U165_9ASTE|nr:hypothetical protein RJ640_022106 [Escallonia rubra]